MKFFLHAIGIILFLTLPVIIAPRPVGVEMFAFTRPALRDFLANVFMITFFYGNYYYFIPKFYLKRGYLIYGSMVVLAFVTIVLLPSLLTGHMPWASTPGPPPDGHMSLERPNNSNFLTSISHNVLLFMSVALFSVLLRVRERLFLVEQAKNRMELVTLKEQINPHFLFNVLNSIYSLAIENNSAEIASSILKLSGMMRYVLEETKSQLVPLDKELGYIDDYMQLQRQRLDDHVGLTYRKNTSAGSGLKIAPLILMPFIENAFKHGINPDEDSKIMIEILLDGKRLTLNVFNRKVNVQLSNHEISGKGITATQARLELLYPDRYELILEDLPEEYRVKLQLNLHDKGYRD